MRPAPQVRELVCLGNGVVRLVAFARLLACPRTGSWRPACCGLGPVFETWHRSAAAGIALGTYHHMTEVEVGRFSSQRATFRSRPLIWWYPASYELDRVSRMLNAPREPSMHL